MSCAMGSFAAAALSPTVSEARVEPLRSCRAHSKQARPSKVSARCQASSAKVPSASPDAPGGEYTPSEGPSSMNLLTAAVNALFSFPPLFNLAASKARDMMVRRGDAIGYPWAPALEELRKHDWDAELAAVKASSRASAYPDYYLQPFHAYETGNLSLQAALEVELAAKAVHATVYDPERKKLDPEGDVMLRREYHRAMLPLLRVTPRRVVDLGCATGLSTFALYEDIPGIEEMIGVDLSPYFLAVANYNLRQRNASRQGKKLPVTFFQAAAEDTRILASSVDLVSICLVCHELPRHATKQIIEEAHRILRPGGAFSIMEMNPHSPLLQQMVNNVFAFSAFKATEPYFDDYRTFPLEQAIAERGFEYPQQTESSPRHRTVVAHKL